MSLPNAVPGFFDRRDFVRPEERDEYYAISADFRASLAPVGILEETFTAEIITATWRLLRCSRLESELGDRFVYDPMTHVELPAPKIQISVDRARNQANQILRHALTELRRLQTERAIRTQAPEQTETLPPLTRTKEVVTTIAAINRRARLASNCKNENPAPLPRAA